ncbi:hsp70-interacting protein [Geosmithia morbida]|uniref:Hsp70-interacting protein n=1 Tax=Geosmithia morbida TaxID=1094350 RepID=A0A9P4YRX7_9HYPO|nr:hsp70-interacting protein [Geosmithia morbida]KAF4120521.1 hsp70-interacting protein [Geosmithia morbida]
MGDKRLNDLLKWSIENSDTTRKDPAASAAAASTPSQLTPEVLSALMGGPSEADLMRAAMEVIVSEEEGISLEDKLIAFDNFEQLIENLDNANNMANMGLWTPLLDQLTHRERDVRRMAAWCIGTAVQNNPRTQEKLLAVGGLPPLARIATSDQEHEDVRRKAVYALSSAVRNYQPALDLCAAELTANGHATDQVDASNMEAVDEIMNSLREKAKTATATAAST